MRNLNRAIGAIAILLFVLDSAPCWPAVDVDEETLGQAAEIVGKSYEAMSHYVAALQNASQEDDKRLREKIINLVRKMKRPPEIPNSALQHAKKGEVAVKLASTKADFDDVVSEFEKALQLAPWWAEMYFNLGEAQERAGKYDDAINSFKWYLLATPKAKNIKQVQNKILEIGYAKEFTEKKKRREAEGTVAKAEEKPAEEKRTAEGKPQKEEKSSTDPKQDPPDVAGPEGSKAEVEKLKEEVRKQGEEVKKIGERTTREFAGLHFGVGISFAQTLGRDRIKSASVVNNLVRVDSENNAIPRVMLESHHFFTPSPQTKDEKGSLVPNPSFTQFCFLGIPLFCMDTNGWGAGPFVALQPGTDEIIQAIAAGVMWGFKYSKDEADNRSWNFGVGVSVEPSSKTLGDGINEGQPLPPGETQVRFKDRTLTGIVALLSFGF